MSAQVRQAALSSSTTLRAAREKPVRIHYDARDAVIAADASSDFLLPGFHQLARPQAVQHRMNAAVLELQIGLFDRQREEYL